MPGNGAPWRRGRRFPERQRVNTAVSRTKTGAGSAPRRRRRGSEVAGAIISMRRTGSAAPHSSWSPTVNAERYWDPRLSLVQPTDGDLQGAGQAIGVRSVTVASLVSGTTCTHSLSAAMICSTSSSGTSRVSLRVRAWRVGAHGADPHAQRVERDPVRLGQSEHLVGLVVGLALLAETPSPRSESIQGSASHPAARRTASSPGRRAAKLDHLQVDLEDRRRWIGQLARTAPPSSAYWVSSSRMCRAPPPEAAW